MLPFRLTGYSEKIKPIGTFGDHPMWIGGGAFLFTGLSHVLVSPPLNWYALHPFAWLLTFYVFSKLKGKRAFFAGWLLGALINMALFNWLLSTFHHFLGIPVIVTPLLLGVFSAFNGLYIGVFAWGFRRIQTRAKAFWPFAIAAWYCALEFLMPQLFNYYQGVSWYQQPNVFLVTSLTGLSGMTFLIILTNAMLLQVGEYLIRTNATDKGLAKNIGIYLLILAGACFYSIHRLRAIDKAEANARPITLAIIQPNYGQVQRDSIEQFGADGIARDLVSLSRDVSATANTNIDIFVWPENALTRPPYAVANSRVLSFAEDAQSEIWTGALYRKSDGLPGGEYHNSAFRIGKNGHVDTARYDKSLLIPFAEYLPMKDTFPFLEKVFGLPGNFSPGEGVKILQVDSIKFSFLICYEVIKSDYVRKAVLEGSEMLINITGDVQSGKNLEQSQYLMLAAAQSAQFGVPLIRSASVGISAYTDARGILINQISEFERGGIVCQVKPIQVPSFYTKHGDWFAWTCVGISIVLLIHFVPTILAKNTVWV